MARIQTYDNDITVTLDDKVIGTDAVDNSTKNFTVGDILALGTAATSYTAGTGIDITDGTISCTVTDTDTTYTAGAGIDITGTTISSTVTGTNPEKLAIKLVPVALSQNDVAPIKFYSVTGNPFTGSIHTNSNVLVPDGDERVVPSSNVVVKLSLGAFVNALQTNCRVAFKVYENAALFGSVQFDYVRDEMHSATFWSYFSLTAGREYTFTIESINNDFELSNGSFIEFEVL